MNRSYIVHGPTGCGKTRNAERMAAALGLTKVQDNWNPMDQVFEPFDTLYLTASEGPWPDQARHVLSFAEAMGRVPDAVVEPKCTTCNDNGVIGGPSFYAPGEGGVPCPDCAQPSPVPADEKPGDSILCSGCFAKGVGPEHFDEAGKCLVRQQTEPLGAEFAQVLSDNLPELLSTAQVEQAEAERPEQPKRYTADVFYHNHFSTVQMEVVRASDFDEFAAQHERIVVALLRQKHEADTALAWATRHYQALEQERDAALARVAELERALQTVVNAADHGSWPTTVMHGIEVAREVLAGPSAQTQPSPSPTLRAAIDVANDRFEVPVAKWGTDLAGEEERPEVVAFLMKPDTYEPYVDLTRDWSCDHWEALMTVAQYERVVGTLRAANAKLKKELAMARDAASKGDAARHAAGGMEMEIQELRSRWTYASTQATNCAGCGEHKHTPLRVDWMGGYVCLTCIDEKLEELHDAQAQHGLPDDDTILQTFADNAEHSEESDEDGYCIVREHHALKIARELFAATPASSEES
ncbi:TPA: hypothetical protein L3889_000516 [Pseudomonas aeruginosa]|uniref:RNA helicase domain-containing protein n=1 Tax=unclassified Pseudomonas TaxID=196821 RepID=UPI0021576E4D|nr:MULTISPECIES: RNA helicase domain-containing protein [unclassified Pseudomonas]HBN9515511.1 hypothetical protein [Pseudomonas aeruginosa]